MKCNKCGFDIIAGDGFCRNCGNSITINNNVVTSNQNNDVVIDNKNATILCIISLVLYLVVPIVAGIIGFFLSMNFIDGVATGAGSIGQLSRIVAFVMMIVARIKYPNSTFAKVLMWIYLGFLILYIIIVVIVMFLIVYLVMTNQF